MRLEAELKDILGRRHLNVHFQPIYACRQQAVHGYEALIRGPSDSPLHAPLTLFDVAGRTGHLVALDYLCRSLAIAEFRRQDLPGKLFLNVTPTSVLASAGRSGRTHAMLAASGLAPDRVVIELTEQFPIENYDILRTAMDHYRRMGFSIAIDDLGAGYAGLRHWSELRPDYVKIDRHFAQGVDGDVTKREFVRSILEIARNLRCAAVVEGVETLEEYRTLWSLGLELAQGYFIGRPQTRPPRSIAPRLPVSSSGPGSAQIGLSETVEGLKHHVVPVTPDTPAEDVAARFEGDPGLRCLAVVRDGQPLGLVQREALMSRFAGRYGRALYSQRPIVQLATTDMVVARQDLPIDRLSQRITDGADRAADDAFVIVDKAGAYVGMGHLVDLLKKITELQVRSARYANPLTGLPGSVPINDCIDRLLAEGVPFSTAYCDLDAFKAYNDVHGYRRGDDVLAALARLLVEHADADRDLVGHVGGDDFIVVFRDPDWYQRCRTILERFEELAPWFYGDAERSAGGVTLADRQGRQVFYPLVSLSIAVVPVRAGGFDSHRDVAAALSEMKRMAKRTPGNSLFVDRRRPWLDGRSDAAGPARESQQRQTA